MRSVFLIILFVKTQAYIGYDSNFTIFYPSSEGVDNAPNYGFNDIQSHFVEPFRSKPFDFIIVGSGAAGSVIANRLSENPKWNVLLLEVGKEPTPLTDIPALCSSFQFTDYNWGYLMEEQENMCLAMEKQRMHWPRGRALGGTSVINYMIHIRGNRLDFDRWAAKGNKGWSYQEVLPYFKKSEDSIVQIQDTEYHNRGGYLGVQDVPYRTRVSHAFVHAMQEFGYRYVDYNGENQMGVSYVQATTRFGKRQSAKKSFLDPVRHRSNLKIITEARVTKILIDPTTKRAYGVELLKDRKKYIARASKEVIISAGALNSPQILMLSGVGPKEHLEELGIPVIQDLPVGKKLYDHLTFLGLTFTINETSTLDIRKLLDPRSLIDLALRGEGPLTSLGGVEALGIVKTALSDDPDPSYPDMEYIFLGGGLHTDKGDQYRKTFRIRDDVYEKMWKPLEDKQAFMVLPMLYHPKSYGFLKLKSKNPFHWPKFYGNFFTDPDNFDIRTFVAGIRIVQGIIKMPAMQRLGAKLLETPIPGCEGKIFDSDPYWECALRHLSTTLHHQVATCKMGPPTDPEAVVSDELRVYGVSNLRVADTSVIPEPITAHTNVPAFMIGEKAADMIKSAWKED